jgi:hypothetical protein
MKQPRKTTKKMGNPAAVTAVSTVASSEAGQKAISGTVNAVKLLLIVGGGLFALQYGVKKYKEWRADSYARENAGNPNLIAAAVIYGSFSRFEFPSILSWILPSFEISTDEAALYQIATKVTNIQAVSDAYKILFDRNLFFDTQKGLDTAEMQNFWNIINSPANNQDTTSFYPVGSKLYVAQKSGITVNQAELVNGKWKGTNLLLGNFKHNELVGEVIAHGKVTESMVNSQTQNLVGQHYYIVKEVRYNQCVWNCLTGVVVQSQVTNEEPLD